MTQTTTDGRTIETADICPYCHMTTFGDHQAYCPLWQVPVVYVWQWVIALTVLP